MIKNVVQFTYLRHHSSLGAAIDYVRKNPHPMDASHSADKGDRWDLGAGFAGALHLAERGWDKGVAAIKDSLAKLQTHVPTEPTFSTYMNTSGAYPSVEHYIRGDPENMVEFTADNRRRRLLHIAIDAGANCNVSAQQLHNGGVQVAALVDYLEAHNVRCCLSIFYPISGYGKRGRTSTYCEIITVKDYDQHLDLDKIAFTISHPAMFRRLGFALFEANDDEIRGEFDFQAGGGYGCHFPAAPEGVGDVVFHVTDIANDPTIVAKTLKSLSLDIA